MTEDRLHEMANKVGIYEAGQAILTRDGKESVIQVYFTTPNTGG